MATSVTPVFQKITFSNQEKDYKTLWWDGSKLYISKDPSGAIKTQIKNSDISLAKSWFPSPESPSEEKIYLLSDSQSNFYIFAVNANATNQISVSPQFISFDDSLNGIATGRLDFGALNYGLFNQISPTIYGSDGQPITPESDAAIIFSDANLSIAIGNSVDTTLKLFKVTLNSQDLGYALAFADFDDPSTIASDSEVYYLGQKITPDQLKANPPTAYINSDKQQLVLVWNNSDSSYSDPIYASLTADAPTPVFDKLTPDKQMQLEKLLQVKLTNDLVDRSYGKLKLVNINGDEVSTTSIKIAVPTTIVVKGKVITEVQEVSLFRLSNGDFVKFTGKTFKNSGDVTLDGAQGSNKYSDFTLVSPSELRGYEAAQVNKIGSKVYKILDLNGDGVFGTAVDKAILTNDSFAIYKTTAGDWVYSANVDLTAGDPIRDAITIVLSWQDQKAFELSKTVVSSIEIKGAKTTLNVAGLELDSISGAAVLHEVSLDNANGIFSTPTVKDYYFDSVTANRIGFLSRETSYDFDLNNDGVIGDAVTSQLSGNDNTAVYQTASGMIYVSKNLGLNIGDKVDSAKDIYVFDLSNAPDRLDTAVFTSATTVDIYYTDITADPTKDDHYKRTFTVSTENGINKLNAVTAGVNYSPYFKLTASNLIQAEVKYLVDIDGDQIIGETIDSIIYGSQTENFKNSISQDVGIYSLKYVDSSGSNSILIAANGSGLNEGDVQPNTEVYFLKNGANSASINWKVPTAREVVATGIFSDPQDTIHIVTKNSSNQYYLNTFDSTGTTVKPKGTLLTAYALYNEEVKLQTDFAADSTENSNIGDTVHVVSSTDSYGIYMLDHSGAIVLSKEGTWVSDSSPVGNQASLNFVALKNSNGTTWMPYGHTQKLNSDGTYTLMSQSGAASIKQVVFNPNDSIDVFLERKSVGPSGIVKTIYSVSFSKDGITKNSIGKALKTSDILINELNSDIDINGDGYIGKPFLGLNTATKELATASYYNSQFSSGYFNGKASVFYGDKLVYSSSDSSLLGSSQISESELSMFYSLSYVSSQTLMSSPFSKNPFLIAAVFVPLTNISYIAVSNGGSGQQISKINLPYKIHDVSTTGYFNQDGNLDFICASYNSINIYKGDGHGLFKPMQNISLKKASAVIDGAQPAALTTSGQFGADKLVDISVLSRGEMSSGEDFISIYKNSKTGFVLQDSFSLDESGNQFMVSGDLNNDKIDDIVLVNASKDQLRVALSSKGAVTLNNDFVNSFTLSGIYSPRKAFIDDINGDGSKDIVVLDSNSTGKMQLEAFFSDGKGSFSSAQTLFKSENMLKIYDYANQSFPDTIVDATLCDLNADGLSDFIIKTSTGYQNNSFQIIWNLSNALSSSAKFNADLTNGIYYPTDYFGENMGALVNYSDFISSLNSLGIYTNATSSHAIDLPYGGGYYIVDGDYLGYKSNKINFKFSSGGEANFNFKDNLGMTAHPTDLFVDNFSTSKSFLLDPQKAVNVNLKPGENNIDFTGFGADDTIVIDTRFGGKVVNFELTEVPDAPNNLNLIVYTSKGELDIHVAGVSIDDFHWQII